MSIYYEDLASQDNGIIDNLFATGMAISSLAINDNTISEESKAIIEVLQFNLRSAYSLFEDREDQKNLNKKILDQTDFPITINS
jgi:hypothetical protein